MHMAVFLALVTLSLGSALVLGGAAERVGAAILAAGLGMSWVLQSPMSTRFDSAEIGIFVADGLTFLAFVVLSLRSQRYWPIWMSALLGMEVVAHVLGLAETQVSNLAYAIVVQIWIYPICLLLFAATIRHRARRRANGADPSWKNSLPNGSASQRRYWL